VRFLLDHDVPRPVADALLRHGHDVVLLREALPITSRDQEVFTHAIDTERVMVTCNRDDFLQLAENRSHPGLIILIRRRSSVAEQGHLLRLIDRAGESGIQGNINFA
jgi:predicted nuclease of predicted toxin-antitoxin system